MKNKAEFDVFFQTNERRIHYQIHRLGISGEWYDEFYSEGIVALWRAFSKHEQSKGDVGTFLNYQIRYRLLDLLRKKLRDNELTEKMVDHEKIHLDDGNRHRGTGMPVTRWTQLILKDKAFWHEIEETLSENQWKWVQYFIIAGLSIKEIMELENVSADAVKGWGREVRRKLKKVDGMKEKLLQYCSLHNG